MSFSIMVAQLIAARTATQSTLWFGHRAGEEALLRLALAVALIATLVCLLEAAS